MDNLRQLLNSIEDFTAEEWEKTAKLFKHETIDKNQYFVKSNEICNKIAFIEKGLFKLFYLIDGEEKIMIFFSENQFVTDYFSYLTATPSIRPIQAIEKSTVYAISRENLESLYRKSKKWEKIGRVLAESSYIFAVQRANRLLHDDYETRFKTFLSEYPTLIQRIPQFMIASYLNMKPETLSRIKKRVFKGKSKKNSSVHDSLNSNRL